MDDPPGHPCEIYDIARYFESLSVAVRLDVSREPSTREVATAGRSDVQIGDQGDTHTAELFREPRERNSRPHHSRRCCFRDAVTGGRQRRDHDST